MSNPDYTQLKNIFQMMSPVDFSSQSNTLGIEGNGEILGSIMNVLLNQQGGTILTADKLKIELENLLQKATDDQIKEFHKHIRFYSTEGNIVFGNIDWQTFCYQPNSRDFIKLNRFESIIGSKQDLAERGKKMSIVLSDSPFLSPMTRRAGEAELFLNFIPTHVLSRCVPYLNVEFVFDRPINANNKLAAPGLLKFLLGAQETEGGNNNDNIFSPNSANSLMVDGNTIKRDKFGDVKDPRELTIAGMEMFTSPQSLVNMNKRRDDVLDPLRPFASIQSLTINITPTVGMYSYKQGNLNLKIHDRSRLHEISDFLSPQIYTKTTAFLTYGWRHPDEPNNPYANFINQNMLVREAFGVSNSSFNFETSGEVAVNLQLYTKGIRELRNIRITNLSESFQDIQNQIQELASKIATYQQQLKIERPTGINKEIRWYSVIEAGSRGEFPDLKSDEIQKIINDLNRNLNGGNLNPELVNNLTDSLKELYSSTSDEKKQQKFSFQERLKNVSIKIQEDLKNDLLTGSDPFLIDEQKDQLRVSQTGLNPHPFAKLISNYNATRILNKDKLNQRNKIVSFGKLFSTFLSRAFATISGIDELQIFFYKMNERCGLASETNIAEFPIDINIFLDQFKEHCSSRQTDQISVEEFLKLCIDAQLSDPRGIGYGFFSYFEQYDPKNPEAKLAKNQEKKYEDALAGKENKHGGTFKMPTIEVYVETSCLSSGGKKNDLLKSFDFQSRSDYGNGSGTYNKITRVHIFDRQVNPYPVATSLLRKDNSTDSPYVLIPNKILQQYASVLEKGFDNLPDDVRAKLQKDPQNGILIDDHASTQKIKRFVSKMMPSIIFGGNTSSIISANISSKQDQLLSSVQMQGRSAGHVGGVSPRGAESGGLPLTVIPSAVSLVAHGNPLLDYGQIYFLDLETGTTLDNSYGLVGITHLLTPGKYETTMNLTFYDSYGTYNSPSSILDYLSQLKIS